MTRPQKHMRHRAPWALTAIALAGSLCLAACGTPQETTDTSAAEPTTTEQQPTEQTQPAEQPKQEEKKEEKKAAEPLWLTTKTEEHSESTYYLSEDKAPDSKVVQSTTVTRENERGADGTLKKSTLTYEVEEKSEMMGDQKQVSESKTTWECDKKGWPVSKKTSTTTTMSQSFDGEEQSLDPEQTEIAENFTYERDKAGRVTKASSDNSESGTVDFSYDEAGNVAKTVHTYVLNENETYSNVVETITYDQQGDPVTYKREATAQDGGGSTTTEYKNVYKKDDKGHVLECTVEYGDGSKGTYTYERDAQGAATSVVAVTSATTDTTTYTNDEHGNPTASEQTSKDKNSNEELGKKTTKAEYVECKTPSEYQQSLLAKNFGW